MPRRAKIVLVSVVLLAGFVVAWQFRKSPADKTTANSAADAPSRIETAQKPAVPAVQRQNAAPPLDLFAAQPDGGAIAALASNGRRDASPPSTEPAAPAQASPAPEKPAEAWPDHTAAGTAAKPAEAAVPELPANFSGVDRPNRSIPSDDRSDLSSDATTAQTHKIVDGDSLPSLAERYLGSASRAAEIFACNRDVLTDPELLPIGVRLRIPTAPASSGLASNPPAGATTDAAIQPTAPLAATGQNAGGRLAAPPTAAAPAEVAANPAKSPPLLDIGAPALSPLPPLGDQTHPPGRTYIVQTGDTLPGIAQKLYGDSGRTDAILQANRDQLRSEQDLRPGMMIETP